jgi:hypothetical protein
MGVLYDRWPDQPILSPPRFAAQWSRLVRDFVDVAQGDPRCRLIRYADVRSDSAIPAEIARFADVDVDQAVLGNVQRGIEAAGRPVSPATQRIIRRTTEAAAAALDRAAWLGDGS